MIGIIGQGFVGSAVRTGFEKDFEVATYDLDPEKRNCDSLDELLESSEVVFACLPTPMKKTGECDTSILEGALYNLNNIALELGKEENPVVVIKSTVPPGTTDRLNERYEALDIIFSPEFLTEANHIDDFLNQSRTILGGPVASTVVVAQLFNQSFPSSQVVTTSAQTAEMVKYFINCFLATKVTFANEMYQICQGADIRYEEVVRLALLDNRIGRSHLQVPGPDGDIGFGGHCFPKDLSALIHFASEGGPYSNAALLRSVKDKNEAIRNDRDWERMKGRAVSEEE